MKIRQKQHFAQVIRDERDDLADVCLRVRFFQIIGWKRKLSFKQVGERAALVAAPAVDRRGELRGFSALLSAEVIARLVGGDGEEPRAKSALRVEAFRGEVDLEKRFLEEIVRGSRVVGETEEKVEELVFVTEDDEFKSLGASSAVELKQLFVAHFRVRFSGGGGRHECESSSTD